MREDGFGMELASEREYMMQNCCIRQVLGLILCAVTVCMIISNTHHNEYFS